MKPPSQKIYLASKSARRRELLRQIGVEFSLLLLREQSPRGPEISEAVLPGEAPADYVWRVAREKAVCGQQTMLWRKLPPHPVLSADTTVTIDGKILGKPASADEAIEILQMLSGRTHQVLTSVCVCHDDQTWQLTQTSEVAFCDLSEQMIRTYCATSEPYDKAGGYGIQGLAAVFIREIAGSYSGVMGLPLYETAQLLREAGVCLP
ncbi:MAG: septum formation protein Maf [Gallionellales bacterium RBG_16_56_9]|nr:MAG: septum formation protein Maf [Gallionellales bacterium RBG_16_56_9]